MKVIRNTELARIMELKPYFFNHNWYNKTLVGVLSRPRTNYFHIEFAKCLAYKFAHKSKVPINQIIRELDEYDP